MTHLTRSHGVGSTGDVRSLAAPPSIKGSTLHLRPMPMANTKVDVRARLGVAFLVPAGVVVGHVAAYGLGGMHAQAAPPHGYLAAVAAVAIPLALVALLWQGWDGARSTRGPSLRLLLVAQPALFVAQEGLEHLLGGHGMASLAHSGAVRVGVVAQVFFAALTVLLVRAARATGRVVVAALRRRRPLPRGAESTPPMEPSVGASPRALRSRVSERGPPSLLVLT